MPESPAVTLYEMSDRVRHFEIAYGTSSTARLYVETFLGAAYPKAVPFHLTLRMSIASPLVLLCNALAGCTRGNERKEVLLCSMKTARMKQQGR